MEYQAADEEMLLEKHPSASPARGNEPRDRFFAVAFGVNIAVVTFIAVLFGIPNASTLYFTRHHEDDSSSHGLKIFVIFVMTSCVGGCVSALWLQILQQYAKQMILWTLRFSIVAFIVAAIVAFYDSGRGGRAIGFTNLLFAVMIAIYYTSVKPSVAFAAWNLATAARILRVFPGIIMSAYLALAAQAAWTLIWSLGVVGVLSLAIGNLNDLSSYGNTCFFFMLLSLFWFVQVAKNVVHCIAAGAVGEWWFGSHDINTIQRSRIRALTTSLGSISLGSLIIAVLNALNILLLSTKRRKSNSSTNACLECMVRLVSRNLQYFNKFAFCQVALYGKDFQTAGRDTMHLFRDRGWSALLNDALISNVLAVGCLVVGTISGVIGSAWLYWALQCTEAEAKKNPSECSTDTFNVVLLTFVACAAIGYAMCTIVSSILDSIVATIFVCFAEDPAALLRSHPEEHARLVDAWGRLKPDLLTYPSHLV